MKVHVYERSFLIVGGVLLLACMGALLYAATVHGVHLPARAGQIDPALVQQTPPFDQPGVRQTGPNAYEVVVVASIWQFQPNEIRVPAGAEITFVVTTRDVIHGFYVAATRVNVMLIPGQISRVVHTFPEPGEHLLICHEYCGLGHHLMGGRVIVE